MKWFEVKNVKNSVAELFIYGIIDDNEWWGDEITPKMIAEELRKIGDAKELNIFINSDGGSVFAGEAIFSQIKRLDIKTTTYIDGLAASIASIIALASDKVIMPENATMIIHNPTCCACGEAADFRQIADRLDKIKDLLIDTYEAKTGLDREKIGEMLDEETWMKGKEALELGFIDELEEPAKMAACYNAGKAVINGVQHDLTKFKTEKAEQYIKNTGMSLETSHRHKMNMLVA